MNEDEKTIPYFVHEAEMTRNERHIRRWFIAFIVVFASLIITNAGWIMHETIYEDVVITESSQYGDGVNILSGGDANYGSDSTNNQN